MLKGIVTLLTKPDHPGGCLMVQGALACGENADRVRQALASRRAAGVAAIRRRFQRAIDEGDDTWRQFLPFELVWSGGRIGRFAAQTQYWWFRSRERSRARQSRNREAEFRRGGAPAARLGNIFKGPIVRENVVQDKAGSDNDIAPPQGAHGEQQGAHGEQKVEKEAVGPT